MKVKAHLAEVFRWSPGNGLEIALPLVSALGLAGPVLIAVAAGKPSYGLAASAGSLMVISGANPAFVRGRIRDLAETFLPSLAAWLAIIPFAGQDGLMNAVAVLLAALAATLCGYSRPMAVAAIRFVISIAITLNLAEVVPHRLGLLILLIAGALWTALVVLVLAAVLRVRERLSRRAADRETAERPAYPAAQTRLRWKRSLTQISGWQYPLRLTACFALAEYVAWLWPGHHAQWIALTVALLSRPRMEATAVRSVQGTLGTVLGVLVADLLVAWNPGPWAMALTIGGLAAVRPVLNTRSFLLYSVAMTPLILMMVSGGQAANSGVLLDRVIATLVGSAAVLVVDGIFRGLAARRQPA